mgnify:CR=1 FL=1
MDASSCTSADSEAVLPMNMPGLFSMPRERAKYHYECAKALFKKGTRISVELERCQHELVMSTSFVPDDVRYQMLLVDVLLACCDTSTALFRLRHILHLEPGNRKAKKLLFKILMMSGKELLKTALRMPPDDEGMETFGLAEGRFEAAQKLEKDLFDSMSSEIWVMKAIAQSSRGHCMQAIDSLDHAIHTQGHMEDDNALCEVYVLKAKVLWQQGLMDMGNKTMTLAAKLNPSHLEVIAYSNRTYDRADKQYREAVDLFGKKEYGEALMQARAALSIVTDDVKLHILVTKIHRLMGNLQEAYTSIQHAITMFKENAQEAEHERRRVRDRYEVAHGADGKDIASLEPTDSKAEEGEVPKSTKSAGGDSSTPHSFGIPPEIIVQSHLILNEMALKYAEDGEYEKAIALLTKVLIEEADFGKGFAGWMIDYRYFVNRGDCYRAQGDFQRAIMDYKAGLHLSLDNWQIKTRLGLTLYQKGVGYFNDGDFVNAEVYFSEAIDENYKVADFFSSRGRARYYLGKYDGAYADYARALELKPGDIDIKRRLEQFATGAQKGLRMTQRADAADGPAKPIFEPLIKTGVGSDERTLLAPGATARALVKISEARKLPHVPSNQIERSISMRKQVTQKAVKDLFRYRKIDRTKLPPEVDKNALESQLGTFGAPIMTSTAGVKILSTAHAISDRKFRTIFEEKQETAKSTPWTMFSNAREVARMHMKKPEQGGKEPKNKLPHTTQAMKAASLERTKQTLANNPLIAGVFTSWDDPALKALQNFEPPAHKGNQK